MSDSIEVLERILTDRRSCRGFLDQQVPRDVIERLLAAAQHTASWCNTQPWQVVITSGEATSRLAEALSTSDQGFGSDIEFPAAYTGVHSERRREVGWQLYEAVGVVKGDRDASAREMLRNFEFFGAPHLAVISTPAELGTYGAVDCGLYVNSFLLAAEALGLATCAQAAVASRSPLLHEWFDIPADRMIVCGIAFGHADPVHPSAQFMSHRVPISESVTF
ncbi:MAG: nitroreductase, partial [Aeromicrobium sp.]|uniref:nitroreductase n=1 Tax=Aeromicrobium sp. TaxID=1871063 RepID=UPI003C52C710